MITQKGKPLTFYYQKLPNVQLNYTTTEKQLQSIFKTMKEFQNVLLEHKIEVIVNHENLTYEAIEITSQRAKLWKSLI